MNQTCSLVRFVSVVLALAATSTLVACTESLDTEEELSGTSQSQRAKKDTEPNKKKPVRDTGACSIVGGGGAVLVGDERTGESCSNACDATEGSNPNQLCSFKNIDIGEKGRCTLTGGAGLGLSDSTGMSRGACYRACEGEALAHPNLACVWKDNDITPVGVCNIDTTNGLAIVSERLSRGECQRACNDNYEEHPGETCNFAGLALTPQ